MTGQFEFSAFLFCFRPLARFHICYSRSIIISNMRVGSDGWLADLQVLGPGFDSQVPHLFNNFSSNTFLCSMPSKDHHASSPSSLPRAQKPQSDGHHMNSTMRISQPLCTPTLKSQTGPDSMGLFASTNLSLGSDTPRVCSFF